MKETIRRYFVIFVIGIFALTLPGEGLAKNLKEKQEEVDIEMLEGFPIDLPLTMPAKLRFVGKLKGRGKHSVNGAHKVTFRLYDTKRGGEPLWSETQTDVEVKKGIIDVVLGSVVTIDLPSDKNYYLGIEIGQDEEIPKRYVITGVPDLSRHNL